MSVQDYILGRDFHVHTNLSVCAQEEMSVENIIRRAERVGYRELGLSDHLGTYLSPEQVIEHRARIAQVPTQVRMYVGCEMMVTPAGDPAVPAGEVASLDYIMVGADHVTETAVDSQSDPERWLDEWVRRMERLIVCPDRVDILAHPLRTLRRHHKGKPLMSHLSTERWEDLLGGLAARGTAIELNDTIENYETCFDAVREFAAIARAKGLKFSLNSDAHGLDRLGFQVNWVRLANELKLELSDFWKPREPANA